VRFQHDGTGEKGSNVIGTVRTWLTGMLSPVAMSLRPQGGRLSLRANFSWTFAGNVVYAASQWGILTVLAKLTSAEMVGRYSIGLAVTAPVFMLTNLQLRQVQATDARREYAFEDYFALRVVMTALALFVVMGMAVFGGYGSEATLVIMAVGAAKTVEAMSDVYFAYLQQRERMDISARALVLKGVFSLVAMAIIVILTGNVLWGSLALAAVWGTVLLGYVINQVKQVAAEDDAGVTLRPVWRWSRLWELTWLALPLGLVMMLISLNTNIPRYFIERTLGESELGYFSAMAYLQIAGTTVVSALGQAASPRLADHYAAGRRHAFGSLLARILALGVVIGVVGVLCALWFGRPLLTLLYRPEYAQRLDVFVWLMVASAISYVASFLGYGMTAARRFRPQLPLFMVTVSLTATGCALLVPGHGMLGAAFSLAAAAFAQVVGSVFVIYQAMRHCHAS
jgi:O-antigen/teichoic acid export membrane protein